MAADWPQFAQFIFIALAFVLAGATLTRRHTRWLAALFAAIGIHGALARLEFLAATPLGAYSYAVVLLYGPLFYLALSGLLRQEPVGPAAAALVAGPAVLGIALIAAGVSGGSGLGIITTAVQAIAILAVYRELRTYESVMEQSRSSDTTSALRWIWSALGFYAAVVVLLTLRAVLTSVLAPEVRATLDLTVAVAIGLVLALLTGRILTNPDWIPRTTAAERTLAAAAPVPNGSPTPEQLARHAELERYLVAQRPFLDPDMSVKALAEQLGWPPRLLSEVINRVEGCSFSHKINQMRIEQAKRLLSDTTRADRTLLEVALEAGFNSKSAFNLMFRRFAGCTPTDFREQQKKIPS